MYDGGQNSRIIAPIDTLAAEMGAAVSLNTDGGSVTIKKSADTLTFFSGRDLAVINGREKKMPFQAILEGGHFYAPVRFFAESLGKSVFWESRSSSMNIFDAINSSFTLEKNAEEYISARNFAVKSDRLLFYDGSNDFRMRMNYTPESKINPHINSQIFNTVRALADTSYYTYVGYCAKSESRPQDPLPYIDIVLAETRDKALQHDSLFSITFYEKNAPNPRKLWKYKSFSQASVIKLELNKLYEQSNPGDRWVDPFYENRLKLALIALFHESTGLNISDYLLEEYASIRSDTEDKYNHYKKSRRFDNVRVDLVHMKDAAPENTVTIYFSYE